MRLRESLLARLSQPEPGRCNYQGLLPLNPLYRSFLGSRPRSGWHDGAGMGSRKRITHSIAPPWPLHDGRRSVDDTSVIHGRCDHVRAPGTVATTDNNHK